MKKLILTLILATVLGGCGNAKWEYKIVYAPSEGHERSGEGAKKYQTITIDEAELKKLGADRWELVSSFLEMETAYPNLGNSDYVVGLQPNVRPQRAVLIFKRKM
jgi:hypothetical protein